MRRLILLLLVLVLPSFAQSKRPFTFEDMMKLKRVGEPVPSPDGKWVLFSVVDVDLAANTKTPHIWIVELGNQTQGPSTAAKDSQANPSSSLGMTRERMLISDQDGDRPRWAPDGKRFAFLSNKEKGSQIWIADFDGAGGTVTGVHRLTDVRTEAAGELWSPDGKNIVFTSDVYPECDGSPAEESTCNAKKLEEREKSKVKALIFDRLLYRHWNTYKEGKRSHIFVVPADACVGTAAPAVRPGEAGQPAASDDRSRASGQPVTSDKTRAPLDRTAGGGCPHVNPRDLTPGDYESPVFSLGGQDNYAFSPDGKELCYTSNHDKVEATSTNNDLWTVPVNVGTAASAVRSGEAGQNPVELRSTRQPGAAVATQSPSDYVSEVLAQTKNITADNPASDSTPLYSPDGKYIAYRAQQRPGYESDQFRLSVYERATGKRRDVLGPTLGDWVGTFIWTPDSQKIF
ncbi:MAG TPA: hypothetical protein VGF08_13650, partial [Terriglobales bacterium]